MESMSTLLLSTTLIYRHYTYRIRSTILKTGSKKDEQVVELCIVYVFHEQLRSIW